MDQILSTGQLMMGQYKDKFEARFKSIAGCSHAVSLNSATTALQIALDYFGARNHEVLVPAGSFITDVSSVIFAGGTPVLVDLNPDTLSFDLADLERKRTSRTKGLIWVHLTGIVSSEHEQILEFAHTHDLFVIEDAAHAHGAKIDGKQVGSLASAGVFSFYPTKIVTGGTGGMLTTNNSELSKFAEQMRLFGKDEDGEITHLGNDWFLDEVRAAVGFHHAAELESQLERRREIAARYNAQLNSTKGISLPQIPDTLMPAWYNYFILLDHAASRPKLTKILAETDGISTKQIYKPVHQEKVFRHLDDGTLLKTEDVLNRALCLPMFVGLSNDDIDHVAERVVTRLAALG